MSTLMIGAAVADGYEILTYKEIVDKLGIKMASARQTVSRKGWRRIKQNDGTVKVEVPLAYLRREIIKDDSKIDVKIVDKVDVDMTIENATLKAENAYLHQRVADLQSDRDSWKDLASKPFWKRLLGRG